MSTVKKLMIVDDEETLTFSLYQTFIMAKQDYEVITASSGEEAVARLAGDNFDLVITDISMPGMTGLELLAQIRQKYPGTAVIVMTAYGSEEKKEEALRIGAHHYIEKPFEIKEIKKLVMDILN